MVAFAVLKEWLSFSVVVVVFPKASKSSVVVGALFSFAISLLRTAPPPQVATIVDSHGSRPSTEPFVVVRSRRTLVRSPGGGGDAFSPSSKGWSMDVFQSSRGIAGLPSATTPNAASLANFTRRRISPLLSSFDSLVDSSVRRATAFAATASSFLTNVPMYRDLPW